MDKIAQENGSREEALLIDLSEVNGETTKPASSPLTDLISGDVFVENPPRLPPQQLHSNNAAAAVASPTNIPAKSQDLDFAGQNGTLSSRQTDDLPPSSENDTLNSGFLLEEGSELKSDEVGDLPPAPAPGQTKAEGAEPAEVKPTSTSPTKVPRLVSTGEKKIQPGRPKSGVAQTIAVTPSAQIPTGIPGQRTMSVERSRSAKSSLSSPRTPSNTPVGTFDVLKLRSPAEECTESTASTPRSSASATFKESSKPRVKSKIGSLDNAKHVAGGGNITIMSRRSDYTQVASKCGSKDNIKHIAKGGDKKIERRKLEWKVDSKIGSLDNAQHKPGGGDRKIESTKLDWNVMSKIGSLDNSRHVPGGGTKKIENLKLDFKEKAHSKVGSKDNVGHKPGGGSKKIETQKLTFRETAQPRIDAAMSSSRCAKNEEEIVGESK